MALLQIDATSEVLTGLSEVEELYVVKPSLESLGADRYRVGGYAAESVIPDLEARGCVVTVMMSTDAIERFNRQVEDSIAPSSPDV
ncbi:hypothetical protein [Streptosporangium sp. KLBMP 9127]|nr:hypothetical protein [Streptosporangium sp. KLBMP 9127]